MRPAFVIHLCAVVAAAVGAGFAQLPGSDAPVLVALQTAMILVVADHYTVRMPRVAFLELAMTLAATMVGRGVSQVLCGWIPGFGNVVNACTAAVITEIMGWLCVRWFERENQDDAR